MEREKRRKMGLYRMLSCSSHLNGNFHFIITFTFVHHLMCIYIYIYIICIYTYMYLLEVKGMKGCEALRHRFPFCGIESFFNSFTLSLSIYLSERHSHTYTYKLHTLSLSPSLFLSVLSLCRLSSLSFSFAPLLSLCCSLQ